MAAQGQARPACDVSCREAAAQGGRPTVRAAPLPIPETRERRPKDVPPRQIVEPGANLTSDPAFTLRKEEFEQWLVRRKEALELKFQAREAELKKAFDAKVRDKANAEIAKLDSRRLTNAEWVKLASYFHTDKGKSMTERDWDRAFANFMRVRDRVVVKDKRKGKTPPVTPDPAPEPGGPSAGALS